MKVKLTEGIVDAELIKHNALTVWLRLPSGKAIKVRKRDLPKED